MGMADRMPKRGDLLFPFLSYAINNNKTEDAVKVCQTDARGIAGFCDIIFAYQLLEKEQINNQIINQSIQLIQQAITNGVFDQLMPKTLWKHTLDKNVIGHGDLGIPLSPN